MNSDGYVCDECGFKLWLPVIGFPHTQLGLYDDARFPGRCLLVFTGHVEHLTELSEREAIEFLRDGRDAARAIRAVTQAERINYAVLGNTEPHLHLHLVPRFMGDPRPERPPWEDPRPRQPLGPERVSELCEALREWFERRDEQSANDSKPENRQP